MRVLYYSSGLVSPRSGSGQTAYNLLETEKKDHFIYYASPDYPDGRMQWSTAYDTIRERLIPLRADYPFNNIVELFRKASRKLPFAFLSDVLSKYHNHWIERNLLRQMIRKIRELKIDLVLVYLASKRDIKLIQLYLNTYHVPLVSWIMDDHDYDKATVSRLGDVWRRSSERIVVSESMQECFSKRFGEKPSLVFNNSLPFLEAPSEFKIDSDRPLRIAYAGSTAGYYKNTLLYVLQEINGLRGELELDIYSHYKKYRPQGIGPDVPYTLHEYLPSHELLERLQEYDVLLLLSSFDEEYRALTETSLASKLADYLLAGRCLLVVGPLYAENVRYLQKYDVAEIITTLAPGAVRERLLKLKRDPHLLKQRGLDAYHFGQKMHDATVNSSRLWNFMSSIR